MDEKLKLKLAELQAKLILQPVNSCNLCDETLKLVNDILNSEQ